MNARLNNEEMLLRRSLNTIKILKEKLESKNAGNSDEPVAVTGMACRFPGGCVTPEAFWKFLEEKGDGVRDVPAERWNIDDYYAPETKEFGKMYVKQAGFLQEDVSEFDAKFFRISPVEAAEMDPQHRFLLETAWEALERAGQNPDELNGSKTGVFIGIIAAEYAMLPRDHSKINTYTGTGNIASIASGRLAHIMGLHGPAISIDTACSSSLVSVHYACESLKSNQCDLALAGGVNMMLLPETFSSLCLMGALEKDGRCKPFDADGQGYGRGEGCGMVVLKRLSDAEKDGDNILAVIRGSAVNHDGASSGLTVPNRNAQKKLIIEALKYSDTKPDEIGYIEAHGTGTSLGDPVEVNALADVFATKTRKSPLLIGSVKGNIGHLEAASGVAGLIKTVLCIENKKIPANINLNRPNPRIRFEKIPAKVPSSLINWESDHRKPRVAGMSSFGFSGTNAHLVISEPDASRPFRPENRSSGIPLSIMKLSAKSDEALKNQAILYQEYLEKNQNLNIEDICHTANSCRADFSCRAAFISENKEELVKILAAFISDEKDRRIFLGRKDEDTRCKTAFYFGETSGYSRASSSWAYNNIPCFQNEINKCSDMFEAYTDVSVKDLILQSNKDTIREVKTVRKGYSFSIQYAFFRLWESWGISPFAVFGKGTGCLTAAVAAGAVTPETAVKHIAGNVGEIPLNEYKAPVCRFLSPADATHIKGRAIASFLRQDIIPVSELSYDELVKKLKEQGCDFIIKIENNHLEWDRLINNLAVLYCKGVEIKWDNFEAGYNRKKILLPTYPFERKHYWIAPPDPDAKVVKTTGKPLKGIGISSPLVKDKMQYEYKLDMKNLPGLADTHGVIHVGYWQEMLDYALKDSFGANPYSVKEINFKAASIVKETETKNIYLVFTQNGQNREYDFVFYGKDESARQWDANIKGTVDLDAKISVPDLEPADKIQKRCSENYTTDIFYQMMESRNIVLGPGVRLIDHVWRRDNEATARLKLSSGSDKAGSHGIGFDPCILDACAQLFHASLHDSVPLDMIYMVVRWEDFAFTGIREYKELWCHATIEESGDYSNSISGAFALFNENGKIICFARKNVMKCISDTMVRKMKEVTESAKKLNVELAERLQKASFDEKKKILADYFRRTFSDIFDIPSSELDTKEPLRNMGMDSMVAISFKAVVEKELDLNIPVEMLIEGSSILKLTDKAVGLMPGAVSATESETETRGVSQSSGKNKIPGSSSSREIWFCHRGSVPNANIRLFCLPYGGHGASLFREWQEKLPSNIEVCPVQVPGRESRINETPIDNIEEMTDMLEKVLSPDIDRPYAFYGHSMGALIAFRAAYRLRKIFPEVPAHFFAGAFRSPSIYPSPTPKKLRQQIMCRRMDAMENDEMRMVLKRAEECDKKIMASWKPDKEEPPFDVPVTVFHGENDTYTMLKDAERWKELTTGDFKRHTLPGGHLFMDVDRFRARLLKMIAQELGSGFTPNERSRIAPGSVTPSVPEEITPEWLTDVLRSAMIIRHVSVISVETEEIGDIKGFLGSVVRLRPKYKGNSAEAPDSLIAKFPSADPQSRTILSNLGLYKNEIRFYSEIARFADVSVPECFYYNGMYSDDHRYLLLLEDMSPSAQVGDCVAGCSHEEAELAVRHAAGFHACYWENFGAEPLPQGIAALADESGVMQVQYRDRLPKFRCDHPETVSDYLLKLSEMLTDHIPSVYSRLARMPRTLIHGDYRLDNLFFGLPGNERRITVADWQNIRIGPGMADVAFFMCLNLEPGIRKKYEQKFLTAYCSVLAEKGIKGYTTDQCLNDYRWNMLFPLIRCMMFFSEEITERVESLVYVKFERLSAALEDHRVAELLS